MLWLGHLPSYLDRTSPLSQHTRTRPPTSNFCRTPLPRRHPNYRGTRGLCRRVGRCYPLLGSYQHHHYCAILQTTFSILYLPRHSEPDIQNTACPPHYPFLGMPALVCDLPRELPVDSLTATTTTPDLSCHFTPTTHTPSHLFTHLVCTLFTFVYWFAFLLGFAHTHTFTWFPHTALPTHTHFPHLPSPPGSSSLVRSPAMPLSNKRVGGRCWRWPHMNKDNRAALAERRWTNVAAHSGGWRHGNLSSPRAPHRNTVPSTRRLRAARLRGLFARAARARACALRTICCLANARACRCRAALPLL